MGRLIRTKFRGFTLVELLIVVAIIGILATVGIPTFKKMTQKAKKSEAKVLLGGLFTAESAFQAEYGVYGNLLTGIGYDTSPPGTYTVGFPAVPACTDDSTNKQPSGAVSTALNITFPTYYSSSTTVLVSTSPLKPTVCSEGKFSDNNGSSFTASATGVIAPGANPGTAGDLDRWTIDNNRKLTNVNDGVK